MKLIVAGGRDFDGKDLLSQYLDTIYESYPDLEIVCGMARGADTLGKMWADSNNVHVAKFPADWDKFGKSAGYRRNAEMVSYADALIAFWNGSRGTKHTIDLAKKRGMSYGIVNYKGELLEWTLATK